MAGGNKLNIETAFKLITDKFDEYEIPWCLVAGSLLGAIRDGKRISWDFDYDIGYFVEYAPDVLKALLDIDDLVALGDMYFLVREKENIEEYHICIKPHIFYNSELWMVKENKFFRLLHAGNYFFYSFIRSLPFSIQKLLVQINMKTYILRIPRGHVSNYESFTIVNMDGVPSLVPVGYDNILKEMYGDDYMTPVKNLSVIYKGGISFEEWRKKNLKGKKKHAR